MISRRNALWIAEIAVAISTASCCLQIVAGVQATSWDAGTVADAGRDGGIDAGIVDAGVDAGLDAGAFDAGVDAGPDAGIDAGVDAGADAGIDAGVDAGMDAGIDAGQDAGNIVETCGGDAASGLMMARTYSGAYLTGGNQGMSDIFLVASADLNGDGLLDLVVGFFAPVIGFDVLFGLDDGGLSSPTFYAESAFVTAMAIGDLNGDGHPDVIIPSAGGTGVDVLLNDGDGGLVAAGAFATSQPARSLALGDLNGDGFLDLVVGEYGQSYSAEWLPGQGDGGFGAARFLPAAGTLYGGIATADVNKDGLVDVIANSADQTELLVLLNQGDGGFLAQHYSTPAAPGIALLPRVDGGSDVVIGNSGEDDWGYSDGGIQVLRNSGDGAFSGGQVSSAEALFLAVGDFNGDGIPDIIASHWAQCGTEVALTAIEGSIDGGFGAPIALVSGQGPSGVAVLGEVSDPRAFAVGDACGGGLTICGDASRH
jgi:hypothetical protein